MLMPTALACAAGTFLANQRRDLRACSMVMTKAAYVTRNVSAETADAVSHVAMVYCGVMSSVPIFCRQTAVMGLVKSMMMGVLGHYLRRIWSGLGLLFRPTS